MINIHHTLTPQWKTNLIQVVCTKIRFCLRMVLGGWSRIQLNAESMYNCFEIFHCSSTQLRFVFFSIFALYGISIIPQPSNSNKGNTVNRFLFSAESPTACSVMYLCVFLPGIPVPWSFLSTTAGGYLYKISCRLPPPCVCQYLSSHLVLKRTKRTDTRRNPCRKWTPLCNT